MDLRFEGVRFAAEVECIGRQDPHLQPVRNSICPGSGRIGRESVSITLTDDDIGWRAVYLQIIGDCLVRVSRCRSLEGGHRAGADDFLTIVPLYVWHGDEHLGIRGESVDLGSVRIGASGAFITGLGACIRFGDGRIAGAGVSIKARGVALKPEDVLIESESV